MSAVGEDARLAAVDSYHLLDAPRPVVLDELTRLAGAVFDAPMSAVTLVGRDREWFVGKTGVPGDGGPLATSFAERVVQERRPLVVTDTLTESQYRAWDNVQGAPNIRFYAGVPLIDEDGHTLGSVCVLDDKPRETAEKQLELLWTMAGQAAGHLAALRNRQLLAELGDELSRAISREEDFVATVSHELRTPVTTIQGYLELLVDNEDLAPYRRLIDPIQRNGERLVRMVDHLLAGTRPAAAPLPLLRSLTDLVAVAEAAMAACKAQATTRDVPIVIEAPEGKATVPGDFTRLSQAAEHLVRNAVLFSTTGQPVIIRIEGRTIEVIDTGAGIPADEVPHVIERFYRGQYAREQAVPGVGLGLSIAERIMRAHDGRLTVTSDGPGRGTIARMSIPG
ncbi:GAF domain-containing sensor histidine kinase [Actinoplanes derwentensis]|uniref:Sensor-like histidine kinase SenX3 n=1 Tax=Actinoplanes derwentensis TaxID=113562 RepID=A0A1H2ADS5_9ACTN|nr:GAF domain-containing sensor histidine kinase [Actinoplanes derwentensis]GID88211.1 sensor histidine kinase [Actinoplanes derwentensis]SDT43912.1 Signal transduction histidine kinase [Actinoplanes derwentensis]